MLLRMQSCETRSLLSGEVQRGNAHRLRVLVLMLMRLLPAEHAMRAVRRTRRDRRRDRGREGDGLHTVQLCRRLKRFRVRLFELSCCRGGERNESRARTEQKARVSNRNG